MLGFMFTILTGSLLLSLPISSADGNSVSYIDALFTATSATCVTGLVTVTTASAWSTFGHAVILVLIQIGGLGVITVMSAFMIIAGKKLSIGNRLLIMDSFNLSSISGLVEFIKKVVAVSLTIELTGALIYMTVFIPEFGLIGIWYSVFNSISAFCNAGMDIIAENSLCNYVTNPVVNAVTCTLIIVGGIGFVVLWDMARIFRERKGLNYLSFHSKLALSSTVFLILTGTVLVFIFEYNNPDTIGSFGLFEKIQASFFQSVTTRTAGFMTIPQENFTNASSSLFLILMFIGGSPVGTAGGIKTVTVFVLIAAMVATVRDKKEIVIFGRSISDKQVRKAVAVFTLSFATLTVSTVLLCTVCNAGFLDILYETVSATGTVGLSRNLTSSFDVLGKIIIIFNMYLGRVGPISLAVAFKSKTPSKDIVKIPSEDINIG